MTEQMPIASADERPASPGVPTQVANPTRTTLRTFVQVVVPAIIVGVPLLNGVLASTSEYLREQADVAVPPWVYLALNGTLALLALLTGLTARIMAVPGVAAWIARVLPGLAPIKPGR